MKIKGAVLLSLFAGLFALGVSLLPKRNAKTELTLPAKHERQDLAIVKGESPSSLQPNDWVATIDQAVSQGDGSQLVSLLKASNLPATAKAHLIDAALVRQDANLLRAAQQLTRKMVESGTAADVLAALPKLVYFSDAELKDVEGLQESLCRFQNSSQDEFGFEVIKAKFIMILGDEPGVRPWPSVCGAS